MLKHISICATLVLLGASAVNAQQQQATLQNVELPGTGIDIVLAMPKTPTSNVNLAQSPDAPVVNLIGGHLALALDSQSAALQAWESLRRLGCAFLSEGKNGTTPIAVYVVPNHKAPAAIRTASLIAAQPEPLMHRVDVPGSSLAIVFAMTKTPVADANDDLDSLAVYTAGSEFALASVGDVENVFRDVGLPQLPVCEFEVEHKGNLPRAASIYIFQK